MGVVTRISPCHVVPGPVLLRRMCQFSPSLVCRVPTCNVHSRSITPRIPTWHQQCGGLRQPATPWSCPQQYGGFRQAVSPFLGLQWTHGHRAYLHTSSPRPISWREFVLSVRVFGGGMKALYNDMKLMKACISEYGPLKIDKSAPRVTSDGKTTLLYPRKELQFMYRVWI